MYPEDYFSTYASLLSTTDNDVSNMYTLLSEVGELCSKPDLEKETLVLDIANLDELNDNNNKPKRTTWRSRSQNQ